MPLTIKPFVDHRLPQSTTAQPCYFGLSDFTKLTKIDDFTYNMDVMMCISNALKINKANKDQYLAKAFKKIYSRTKAERIFK